MNKVRFLLVLLLVFSWGFHEGLLHGSGNSSNQKNIIAKADSLFIAQSKPLSQNEWAHIVTDIYADNHNRLEAIAADFEQNHRFNGAVMIAKGGVPIYQKHAGYADFETGKLLDSTSRFQLASVSKQFTAVAILLLQQKGQLNIDDKLTDFFPELKYDQVTLRHLLTHEAGFPSYMWMIARHWKKDEPPTNRDIVKILSDHPVKLMFTPGSRFRYSNTGYCLLAAVVERVSHKDFDVFLEDEIFDPLNMDESFAYSAAKDTLKPNMVRGFRYYYNRYHKVDENLMEGTFGDKGIYSTPGDLVKWMDGLQKGRIVSKELLDMATSPSDKSSDKHVNYGLGFRIYDNYLGKMVYHNGSWSGFRTTLRSYPEEDLTIVVLTNNSYLKTGVMARSLTSSMLEDVESDVVFDLAKDFVYKSQSVNKELITGKSLAELQSVKQVMNSLSRGWMADRFDKYIDEMNHQDYEWFAMNQK